MNSLHFKLFTRYAALVFSILMIFMILIYTAYSRTLLTNAKGQLQADCDNISTLLNTQMDQMNLLSKRIVSSKQLQTLFIQDLYSDDMNTYGKKLEFSNALFDIIKLSFDHMELNLLDTSGRYIHVGNTSTFKKYPDGYFNQIAWFNPVLNAYGKELILPTRIPEYNQSSSPAISLCRAFSPENPTKETAVLEVQIDYTYINQIIKNAIHNQKEDKKIFIYNQHGDLIYPYESPPSSEIESYMLESLKSLDQSNTATTFDDKKSLFACKKSSYTDWTVFVTAPEETIFSEFYLFRTVILIVSVGVLALILLITYKIASNLARPLKKLEQVVFSLSLDNLNSSEFKLYKSNFRELDSLYNSFEQMRKNLQNSLQEVVSAHTVAVDAKLLALQSQTNPHFLYNALASISILSEEKENDKIIDICNDLSMLLRYISSNSSFNVQLWQEIEYTLSYIRLIKIKYEERIQFHIQIDEPLLYLSVPKLIVQPLVENCTKYALNVTPPWIISIKGFIRKKHWVIQIRDNGGGFAQEYLEGFNRQIQTIDLTSGLPDLSIDGMGILNLYTRLFLLYKEDLIFKIENNSDVGACVTIGGPLPDKMEVVSDEKSNN